MAYYKEKVESGNEYVTVTQNLYIYTLNKCMMLPQRWYDAIVKPVIEPITNYTNLHYNSNTIILII